MGRVYVTGMGVVSSLGFGRQPYWDALVQGRSGVSEVSLFDTSSLPRQMGGEVKGFVATDYMSRSEAGRMGRCSAFSVAAARMHMVVLLNVTERHVRLIDPELGVIMMGRDEFDAVYTRQVIIFEHR